MHISRLRIENYRIYREQEVQWGEHINLITGPNGAGKTNLIDAVHYLCMSRSFVTATDHHAVHRDAPGFRLQGAFSGSIRPSIELEMTYSRGEGKSIRVNGAPLERLSDLIGMVPVVVLSPDDKRLTNEGPELRRNFLDAMISQVNPGYLRDLVDYRRAMRQRNRLLVDMARTGRLSWDMVEPWDDQLARTGAKIMSTRHHVLGRFASYMERAYAGMAGIRHQPSYRYRTFSEEPQDAQATEAVFRNLLLERREKDVERGSTLVGPHRDEIQFLLDGHELRKYGSQGQHRLFALSLKLAQLYFFSDLLDDLPIFLLDDVFGDLDPSKTKVLLEMLAQHPGQTFITAANTALLETLVDWDNPHNRFYRVDDGNVAPQATTHNHVPEQP